ncbi:MAG: cyclic nucleotide-binding domain-containing protein [Holophagales bacterium]|nr:cyclic nucleotide-binding domain-containing protein [Holophagales bacterium]
MSYTSVEYQAQDVVFKQGEPGDYMCLIQAGELEVVQELGGYEKQVAVLERGDFFGEMAILEDEPRTHSVRALSEVKLIKIDRDDFPGLLAKKPDVAVRMFRKLGNRLSDAQDMLFRAWAGAESVAVDDAPKMFQGQARLVYLVDNTELALPLRSETKIGRVDPVNNVEPDIDLTKIDTQLTTSRRHARILRRSDGFYILEERATNGTYVNGQRISAERPLEIRSGDDIMFGAVRMRFLVD